MYSGPMTTTNDNIKKFNIQLAAQMSGLSTHTIRAWEKRYQALTPQRNDIGRRLYSTADIDRLVMLAQLTQLGTSISQIANLSDEELRDSYNKFVQHGKIESKTMLSENKLDLNDVKRDLLDAVTTYKVETISQILGKAKLAVAPKTFALEILNPLLQEVRHRREQGFYQDAQLQALYAIAKFHAGNIIYSHFEKGLKSSQRIVLTSVEKEHHTFPLLISALLCCHHKKHFYYFNSNLPGSSVIDAVKATEATVLILSVPGHFYEDQDGLDLLDEVINSVSQKVKVWLISDEKDQNNVNRWKNTKRIKSYNELDDLLGNVI